MELTPKSKIHNGLNIVVLIENSIVSDLCNRITISLSHFNTYGILQLFMFCLNAKYAFNLILRNGSNWHIHIWLLCWNYGTLTYSWGWNQFYSIINSSILPIIGHGSTSVPQMVDSYQTYMNGKIECRQETGFILLHCAFVTHVMHAAFLYNVLAHRQFVHIHISVTDINF